MAEAAPKGANCPMLKGYWYVLTHQACLWQASLCALMLIHFTETPFSGRCKTHDPRKGWAIPLNSENTRKQ